MFKLILIPIFILDRVILVFMFWENSYKFSKWQKTETFVLNSIIRCFVFCLISLFALTLLSIE